MPPKRITRVEAISANLTYYYTGKRCTRGHTAKRYAKSTRCVQCDRETSARSRQNVDSTFASVRKREINLKTRYGIDLAEYMRMAEEQDSRCALCRNLAQGMMVDHCHTAKKVRGLLCSNCNSILGYASDNITVLQLAVEYLVKHS